VREAIVIFAVIFAACLFAIGAFIAACWYAINRMPPQPAVLADANTVPYSPPVIRPLFIAHEPLAMPTFQRLAVDSADEKGAWGPTA
jgi:hypothetical protein